MDNPVLTIDLPHLAAAFAPVLLVMLILLRWSIEAGTAAYALTRMLGQLLLIGYLLSYLFAAEQAWIIVTVLSMMVFASSWIALRTIPDLRRTLFLHTVGAIALGGSLTLAFVVAGVLALEPWHQARYTVPLAGMVYANGMNAVSLAADRLIAERDRGLNYTQARAIAMRSAMIPNINGLFAVGLVSLPGMMTGQILSGVSPLIAVRYQIMVMCMIFASAGLSAALFLILVRRPAFPDGHGGGNGPGEPPGAP